MSLGGPGPGVLARARRPGAPGAGRVLAFVLLLAALPRLWRFEAVGEGTDEAYSVTATRAVLDGRFSWRDFDDFAVDAYQAKLCPVAELVAVPFVALLGDRPASFRLPSLLASLATLLLLVRLATRRFGPVAGWTVVALLVVDYRSVIYAQTHRYVAIEQLLAVLLLLAVVRAERRRSVGAAVLVLCLGLLLFHTHLLAVLTVGSLGLATLLEAGRRGAPRLRRPPVALLSFLVLAVWCGLVLALFRAIGLDRFFAAEDGFAALTRAASSTARMLAGQGPGIGTLGLLGAIGLLRARDRTSRAIGLGALVPVVVFALGSLRFPLAPRYVLTAQPFLALGAGALVARLAGRLPERAGTLFAPRILRAGFVGLLVVSALPTLHYLRTGGGRDAEADLHAALRVHAQPDDRVLYDDALFDPFGRRPPEFPSVSRAPATDRNGEAAMDRLGVRFVVRSSEDDDRPAYTPSLRARLEPVATSRTERLFQRPLILTLYRLRR